MYNNYSGHSFYFETEMFDKSLSKIQFFLNVIKLSTVNCGTSMCKFLFRFQIFKRLSTKQYNYRQPCEKMKKSRNRHYWAQLNVPHLDKLSL